MACGHFGRFANRANLLSGHGRFLLERPEAEATFERIAGTVRRNWKAEMQRAGTTERNREMIRTAFMYP